MYFQVTCSMGRLLINVNFHRNSKRRTWLWDVQAASVCAIAGSYRLKKSGVRGMCLRSRWSDAGMISEGFHLLQQPPVIASCLGFLLRCVLLSLPPLVVLVTVVNFAACTDIFRSVVMFTLNKWFSLCGFLRYIISSQLLCWMDASLRVSVWIIELLECLSHSQICGIHQKGS